MKRLGVVLAVFIGVTGVSTGHAVASTSVLDSDSATLEGSLGSWAPSFNAKISRSAGAAHSGAHGLEVRPRSSRGWSVATRDWPGFAARAGTFKVSFWARTGSRRLGGVALLVRWRDAAGSELRVDSVPLPNIPSVWTKKTGAFPAPPGTAFAALSLVNSSPFSTLAYQFDDFEFEEVSNLVDPKTSELEGSIGAWAPWYGIADLNASSAEAYSGHYSLRINVGRPGPDNWGATTDNWPGSPAGPGKKVISFAGLASFDSVGIANLRVVWRDAQARAIQTDSVLFALTSTGWKAEAAETIAPPLTSSFTVELTSGSVTNRGTFYFDDFVVADTLTP